jgi:uncharacterized membrane protein (UPF0127 family)
VSFDPSRPQRLDPGIGRRVAERLADRLDLRADWFDDMSPAEQQQYVEQHPGTQKQPGGGDAGDQQSPESAQLDDVVDQLAERLRGQTGDAAIDAAQQLADQLAGLMPSAQLDWEAVVDDLVAKGVDRDVAGTAVERLENKTAPAKPSVWERVKQKFAPKPERLQEATPQQTEAVTTAISEALTGATDRSPESIALAVADAAGLQKGQLFDWDAIHSGVSRAIAQTGEQNLIGPVVDALRRMTGPRRAQWRPDRMHVWFYRADAAEPVAEITADVAATPLRRAMGLSRYRALSPSAGMLFLPPDGYERHETFHMSTVPFPIDIVFVRRSGQIGKIAHDVQPGDPGRWSYPHTMAVVEVVGGFCRQHGVDVGDEVQYAAVRTSFRALVCPSCGTNRNVHPSGSVGSGDRAECIGCGREGPLSEFDQKIAQQAGDRPYDRSVEGGDWEVAGLVDGESDTIFGQYATPQDAERAWRDWQARSPFPGMQVVVRRVARRIPRLAQASAFYTCNVCERTFESADRRCPACGSDDLTPLEEIPLARDTPYRFSRRLLERLRHRPDLVASGPMSPIQDVPSAEPEEESGSDDSSSTWDSGKSAGPMEQEGQARSYDVLRTITEASVARRKR